MIITMFRIFFEGTRMSRQGTEHSYLSECVSKGKRISNICDLSS